MPVSIQVRENLAYLLYSLRFPTTVIDLLLVTLSFFVVLILLRRTRAAVLLRGAAMVALLLVITTAFLPLPTFNLLVQLVLLAGLIATPAIFQPELRRGLERLGRTFGVFKFGSTELANHVVPILDKATTNLSSQCVGALFILEGETSLADVIDTGTSMQADLSEDLLETIFAEKTPLHDGAVVIREDRIEAAACVLPLSEQTLPPGMHQGTRHRAGLGASENYDCLAIIVSEETGRISVAYRGRLERSLESTELRERLYRFYDPLQTAGNGVNSQLMRRQGLAGFWSQLKTALGGRDESRRPRQPLSQRIRPARSSLARVLNYALTFLLAALLGVVAWLLVSDRVNPPVTEMFPGVELRINNPPQDMIIVTSVPKAVSVSAQAPQDVMTNLLPESFRASLDLAGLGTGLHHLPVQAVASDSRVRMLESDPPVVDVELQPFASRSMTVEVVIEDPQTLPFAYNIFGQPTAEPSEVLVEGPADLVSQVDRAEAVVVLDGARSNVTEERPVVLVDEGGEPLVGLMTHPEKVLASVDIRQQFNRRDAAVHVVITGTVAPGYWISNITTEPKTVTLEGQPAVLNEMPGFVDTVPVDVSGAAGDIKRQVPLDPPAGVRTLNESGEAEDTVEVNITVVPQTGNLRVTVPVEVIGAQPGDTVSKSPAAIEVLLAGPLPVLNEVSADPKLVRVVVDVSSYEPGTFEVTPELILPEMLRATMIPGTVQVTVERAATSGAPQPTGTPGPGGQAP